MRRFPAAGLTALLALGGCGGVGVTVAPIGTPAALAPKPPGCAVEFLRKKPERAFEPLAELTTHLTVIPEKGPLEALREPACRLGADAVVVTRSFVINEFGHTLMSGIAIRWRAETPPAAEAPPSAAEGSPPPAGDAPPAAPDAAGQAPAGPSSQ